MTDIRGDSSKDGTEKPHDGSDSMADLREPIERLRQELQDDIETVVDDLCTDLTGYDDGIKDLKQAAESFAIKYSNLRIDSNQKSRAEKQAAMLAVIQKFAKAGTDYCAMCYAIMEEDEGKTHAHEEDGSLVKVAELEAHSAHSKGDSDKMTFMTPDPSLMVPEETRCERKTWNGVCDHPVRFHPIVGRKNPHRGRCLGTKWNQTFYDNCPCERFKVPKKAHTKAAIQKQTGDTE